MLLLFSLSEALLLARPSHASPNTVMDLMLPILSPSWNPNEVVLHDIDTTQWKWDPSVRFIDVTDQASDLSSLLSSIYSIFSFSKISSRSPAPRKYIRFIENILTPQECQELINFSEHNGFDKATINIGGTQRVVSEARNHDRCIIDDSDLVNTLWQRIRLVCSDTELSQSIFHSNQEGVAIGLNERMRILRYDPGAYFAPHYDGSYVRSTDKFGQRSLLTAQFYLNEGYAGGSTRFLNERNESQYYEVIPKVGSVLIFEHDIFHEGAELFSGRKYSLRTDVMYSFFQDPPL